MFELAPKTEKLLGLFASSDYGTEFSYEKILSETGCDLREGDRQRIYTVVRRLERDHRRTLLNLRGRGYKVAQPGEFVGSMRVRAGRAKTQIVLAERTGQATPLELLNDIESREHADYGVFVSRVKQAFAYQTAWNAQQDRRIAEIERKLGMDNPATIEGDAVEDDSTE